MSALTILLMRHGEKPDPDSDLPPGLTAQGAVDKHSLVIRGWQRAGAWAVLFGSAMAEVDFPRPDFVYAADPKPQPDGPVGQRAFETVTPLCDRLGLEPNTTFGVGDEPALIDDVLPRSGVALICWEHKKITEVMIPQIVKDQQIGGLPRKWDKRRFDTVLRFDRAAGDGQWSYRSLTPRLLAGDSSDRIDAGAG